MAQETTKILFEELAKNQDDLRLFLGLHFGFDEFFRTLSAEFLEKILCPALKASANNRKLSPSLLCQPAMQKGYLLTITAQGHWPKDWEVVLGKEGDFIFAGIYTKAEAEQNNFEELKSSLMRSMNLKFPEEKIQTNPKAKGVWFFYSSPYQNWKTEEGVLKLAQEVAAVNGGAQSGSEMSFTWRYVEDLLALAEIVDEVYAAG